MRNRLLLLLQSVLCIILVVMLAAAAIGIYRSGIAERQDNPLAWVYSREKVAAALKPAVPVFFLSVGVTVICSLLRVRDENRHEADAASSRLKEKKAQGIRPAPKAAVPPKNQKAVRLILLAVAVVFIIAGIRNGSMDAVINKAIRICTECIGLG